MKKKIISLLTIICVVVSLTGCILKLSTPEGTVQGFIKAINKCDIKKALEYVEPGQAKGIEAIISLSGDLMGMDLNSILEVLPLFSPYAIEEGSVTQLDIEITDVSVDGEYADVTLYEKTSGEEMTLSLIQEEGVWYILIDDSFF